MPTILSSTELKVLAATQLDADRSAVAIAEVTRLRADTVRRVLDRLLTQGAIRRTPIVDIHRLGLMHYGFYFSLASARRLRSFLELAQKTPAVSSISEYSGEYRFMISIMASSPQQAYDSFQSLLAHSRAEVARKAVSVRLALWELSHLHPEITKEQQTLALTSPEMGREKLDENERIVLKGLESQTGSYRELARFLRMSHTTLDAVVRRLKARGILRGIIYSVHPREIGRLPYKILITTQGLGPDLGRRLLEQQQVKVCASHYVHSLGTWDHELNVAVASPLELSELCDAIQSDFADEISDLKTLALLRVLKRSTIPLVES